MGDNGKVSNNGSAPQEERYGPIYTAMLQFFEEDNWNFKPLEDQPVLRMGFQGDNGNWACFARARDESQRFIFYSSLELRVPAAKRPDVAEFLTRANYGMLIGNFEMDYADGEVRYRTSVDVEGSELVQTMIKNIVYVNVLMMDKYLPGLMSVIYAGVSPQEAIEKVEAPEE